jgi:hypothetical protein
MNACIQHAPHLIVQALLKEKQRASELEEQKTKLEETMQVQLYMFMHMCLCVYI